MAVQILRRAGILRRSAHPEREKSRTIVVLSRETGDHRNHVDVIVENFIYAMRYIVATRADYIFNRVFLSHIKNQGQFCFRGARGITNLANALRLTTCYTRYPLCPCSS